MKLDKKTLIPFSIFWIIDSVLLYLAAVLFPQYFTIGNWRFSPVMAVIFSGLIWTGLVWFSEPLFRKAGKKLEKDYQMAIFYFIANFAALWVTARLAPFFGFGTTRFIWILGLAFVANLIQFAAWKIVKSLV